jgi:hypothetical protein
VQWIRQLVNQLGVQEGPAMGGAGLIFKLAKERLDSNQFSQLARAIPGAEGLINDAPQSGGVMSAIGGLASKLGGKGAELGNMASLASGFSKLGLDSSMLSKFLPIVISYVQDTGGAGYKNLLEKALKPGK